MIPRNNGRDDIDTWPGEEVHRSGKTTIRFNGRLKPPTGDDDYKDLENRMDEIDRKLDCIVSYILNGGDENKKQEAVRRLANIEKAPEVEE